MKSFIGVFMAVPDELTLQFRHFELVFIHLGDDPWLPLLVE
jgi:hypothetical protein